MPSVSAILSRVMPALASVTISSDLIARSRLTAFVSTVSFRLGYSFSLALKLHVALELGNAGRSR
jgi:hypothetical protein